MGQSIPSMGKLVLRNGVLMISEERLHKILLILPGLGLALILFFIRDWQTAAMLIAFDLLGAIGQTWWLLKSQKLASMMRNNMILNNGKIVHFHKYRFRGASKMEKVKDRFGLSKYL